MTKCVLCGKARAENEMRPLINVDELAVGNALSEADEQEGVEAVREVGGATLQVVCRPCWHAILESKEKGDVIEMLETLCGLLFEVERRRAEERERQLRAAPALGVPWKDPAVIEKRGGGPVGAPRRSQQYPVGVPSTTPVGPGGWSPTTGKWAVGGATDIRLSSGSMSALGDQWDGSFGNTSNSGGAQPTGNQ